MAKLAGVVRPAVVARKAVRLAAGIARARTRYPALRARPATERDPPAALAEIGLPLEELESLRAEYAEGAPRLFSVMLERARELGAELPAGKLARPELPAHVSKELVYLAVRATRPEVVVETGTYNGTYSTFILAALEKNGHGRLISLDVPARTPIAHAIDTPLPAGSDPGWIVPDELRGRLEIVLGDARETLLPVLEREGRLDLFLHDSLHTTRHMLWEFRVAWRQLRPGGLLLSDDAFMTPAVWWFARRRGVPFRHVGAMAALRKPL